MQFFRRAVAHLGAGIEKMANQLEQRQESEFEAQLQLKEVSLTFSGCGMR